MHFRAQIFSSHPNPSTLSMTVFFSTRSGKVQSRFGFENSIKMSIVVSVVVTFMVVLLSMKSKWRVEVAALGLHISRVRTNTSTHTRLSKACVCGRGLWTFCTPDLFFHMMMLFKHNASPFVNLD